LKRASFLASSAAATLAGCGGHHAMKALPGVAPSSTTNATGARFTAADTIPDSVILNPIVGEVRRYDGMTPPSSSWMLAQGQQVRIADNPHLFSILRTAAGGDGKSVFDLPKPQMGYIIAVAGFFPGSPKSLALTGRHFLNHADSLGDGAQAVAPRMKVQRPAALAEFQHRPRSVAAAPPRWTPLSSEVEAHIAGLEQTARVDALEQLESANRSLVGAVTDAVVANSLSLVDAIGRMKGSLSASEAAALLAVNDRMLAADRPGWSGAAHRDPALEAARFLIAVAFTPEQLRVVRARG
jgi:hypothetical protein